jgi:hypothetical protein
MTYLRVAAMTISNWWLKMSRGKSWSNSAVTHKENKCSPQMGETSSPKSAKAWVWEIYETKTDWRLIVPRKGLDE